MEQVSEYVKAWTYQNRKVNTWDQVYLFGKQQQYEYRFLSNGVKNIVTDSPCFLSVVYSAYYGNQKISDAILALCREYDKDHTCANIFLKRGNKEYIQEGRWQDKAGALALDEYILNMLAAIYGNSLIVVDYSNKKAILDYVTDAMDI